jgi:hypothetical protein
MEQLLFDTIGAMTGGLITDIYTVMVALLGIGFLCMGFDLIKRAFESIREKRQETLLLDDKKVSRGSSRGSVCRKFNRNEDEED